MNDEILMKDMDYEDYFVHVSKNLPLDSSNLNFTEFH